MIESECAYWAGFLDNKDFLRIYKERTPERIRYSVGAELILPQNTPLQLLIQEYGGKIKPHKNSYSLYYGSERLSYLLNDIGQFLGILQPKASVITRFLELKASVCTTSRASYYESLHEEFLRLLNQKLPQSLSFTTLYERQYLAGLLDESLVICVSRSLRQKSPSYLIYGTLQTRSKSLLELLQRYVPLTILERPKRYQARIYQKDLLILIETFLSLSKFRKKTYQALYHLIRTLEATTTAEDEERLKAYNDYQAHRIFPNLTFKKCNRCNRFVDVEEFYSKYECEDCTIERNYLNHIKQRHIHNAYQRQYRLTHKSTPSFVTKLKRNIRKRIKDSMMNPSPRENGLLGCSGQTFHNYIEKQFSSEMTWQNYGTIWHLDHKRPCASFDFNDPIQRRKCFHYLNYQPMLGTENLAKSDFLPSGKRGRYLKRRIEIGQTPIPV